MTSIGPIIIPELFLVLLASYYSHNYAGILASPLTPAALFRVTILSISAITNSDNLYTTSKWSLQGASYSTCHFNHCSYLLCCIIFIISLLHIYKSYLLSFLMTRIKFHKHTVNNTGMHAMWFSQH